MEESVLETSEEHVERHVQFWTLIGPFLFLAAIGILLFKVSTHWYYPLSAVIGIPLCVKWKTKGMAAALACLFVLALLAFRHVNFGEQYWHVGMTLSMAFSLIVLTLSLEEVEGLLGNLKRESRSRLDNFLHLNESLKTAEQTWEAEKKELMTQLSILTQENSRISEEKLTFYKLARLAKEELTQLHQQHQNLLLELVYKKQQVAELNEKVEETELTIQDLLNSDNHSQIQLLTEQLALLTHRITAYEQEKERLHAAIVRAQDHCQNQRERNGQQRQLIQEQEQGITHLRNRLVEAEERAQRSQQVEQEAISVISSQETAEQKLLDQAQALQCELNHTREQLEQSKQRLQEIETEMERSPQIILSKPETESRPFEAMYRQLQQQFEEKTCTLEKTRQELFIANEQLEALRISSEEHSLYHMPMTEKLLQEDLNRIATELEALEWDYQREIEELYQIIGVLS